MAKGQQGIQIKSKAGSGIKRAGRARAKETTRTMNGVEESVVAARPSSKPVVLRSEKAAQRRGDAHDALKASRVLIAAAYRVAGDVTSLKPAMSAFGTGVPVDMAVGVSVDAQGKAVVKVTCRVDGREVELEG